MGIKTTNELTEIRADLKRMSTAELHERFADGLRLTRERLLQLGATLVELESRGEKVAGDPTILAALRRIGHGELAVEVVLRFADRPKVLSKVAKLPKGQQAKVLQQTDEEVFKTYKHSHVGKSQEVAIATRKDQVAHASTGDAGAIVLDLVLAAEDPRAVAEWLLPKLLEIKNGKKRLSFSEVLNG